MIINTRQHLTNPGQVDPSAVGLSAPGKTMVEILEISQALAAAVGCAHTFLAKLSDRVMCHGRAWLPRVY